MIIHILTKAFCLCCSDLCHYNAMITSLNLYKICVELSYFSCHIQSQWICICTPKPVTTYNYLHTYADLIVSIIYASILSCVEDFWYKNIGYQLLSSTDTKFRNGLQIHGAGRWWSTGTFPQHRQHGDFYHGPLTRCVKLWVAHTLRMPGTFPHHHGLEIPTCIAARAWRMN